MGTIRTVSVLTLTLLPAAACSDAGAPDATVRVDTLDGIEHTVAADAPERGDAGLDLPWRAPDAATVLEGTEWANPSAIAMNEDYIAVVDVSGQVVREHRIDRARPGEPRMP